MKPNHNCTTTDSMTQRYLQPTAIWYMTARLSVPKAAMYSISLRKAEAKAIVTAQDGAVQSQGSSLIAE